LIEVVRESYIGRQQDLSSPKFDVEIRALRPVLSKDLIAEPVHDAVDLTGDVILQFDEHQLDPAAGHNFVGADQDSVFDAVHVQFDMRGNGRRELFGETEARHTSEPFKPCAHKL
jgi:hypothetical protein